MRGRLVAASCGFLVAGCSAGDAPVEDCCVAPLPNADAGPLLDAAPLSFAGVDKVANEELAKQKIPGLAIGIAKEGSIRYLGGYGYADLSTKTLMDPKTTLIRWASISKTLAGTLLVQLVDEGKVALDASIRNYYGTYSVPANRMLKCGGAASLQVGNQSYNCKNDVAEIPLADDERKITLRQLASHTAGIQHYANGLSSPMPPASAIEQSATNTGMEWALAYFVKQPLVGVPGMSHQYSTFGANLAGVVLEKATGMTFDVLVTERISKKAGLTTLAPDYGWVARPQLAKGYSLVNGAVKESPRADTSWKLAGGGYLSTVEDMTRYCAAFHGTSLLSEAQKATLLTDQRTENGDALGIGLFIDIGSRNNRSYAQHSGGNDWTATKMRFYRADGLCIAVMATLENADASGLLDRIEDAARAAGL